MSTCQKCNVENQLDQWFEVPRLEHLVCPRCAKGIDFARPITANQMAERILELTRRGVELRNANEELTALVQNSPDIAKQLRRLARMAERMYQVSEKTAEALTTLADNLSPRWVFTAGEKDMPQVTKVLRRLATEAGPGAIMRVTGEEMSILKSVHRL